jgi:hypothetical protein
MFCMNCGTKLPDNAKFCYNCGAKIPEGLGPEGAAAPESPEPLAPAASQSAVPVEPAVPEEAPAAAENALPAADQEVTGSHFTVLGKYQVELPRATALYNQLWAPFNREGLRAADRAQEELSSHLKEHEVDNPVEFSSRVLQYCLAACDPFFEKSRGSAPGIWHRLCHQRRSP